MPQEQAPPSYAELTEMGLSGNIGDYLKDEWDIGSKYEKYFTPFQKEPFELMREERDVGRASLLAKGRKTFSQQEKMAGQTGLASSGQMLKQFEQAKTELLTGFQSADIGYQAKKYDEQRRQSERLYDEITSVTTMIGEEGSGDDSVGWHPAEGDFGVFGEWW